jgi:hypothetical protein
VSSVPAEKSAAAASWDHGSSPGCHNDVLIRILTAILVLALCACEREPESYPVPEQRQPVEGANPVAGNMMIDMDSPDVAPHIVKDVYNNTGSSWRWTGAEPTLKVLVFTTDHLKLTADFSLWEEAFKQTGPLELTFLVNGKTLDDVRYTSPGAKHFEKLVPPDWLATDVESTIAVKIDKLYVAPQDGAKFGVILSRIGFVQ